MSDPIHDHICSIRRLEAKKNKLEHELSKTNYFLMQHRAALQKLQQIEK